MAASRFAHIHAQVADFLRSELHAGRWTGEMPGRNQLVGLLGVSGKTVDLALQQLEAEKLLVAQGAGKKRRIAVPDGEIKSASLRIQILLFDKVDAKQDYYVELKHRLEDAGHIVAFSSKSLHDLGMNPQRVAAFVEREAADAWVVSAGSFEILQWFSRQPLPAFALFGRKSELPIAGATPRKLPAFLQAVDELVELGHRRIVMLVREERRKPHPALTEKVFLERLKHHGIETSSYNLPDWQDDMAGFHACLDSLFTLTPPSALLISEAPMFMAAMQHLSRMGIHAPENVSLLCDDPDNTFRWCEPAISHIRWDPQPLIRRVVQWTDAVARGRKDLKQTFSRAEFIRGGTIGPVPK